MPRLHFPHFQESSHSAFAHEAAGCRFLALAQASADVFWWLSQTGEMRETNSSWHTFTNQQTSQCLGRGWLNALHPADQPQIEATIHQAVTSARPVEMECHIRRGGRAYHLVRVRAIPVQTTDGDLHEVILCGTDITTQEQAGQMSEAEVQLALKASGVGMWDWDLITNQINWTDQGKALLGLAPTFPLDYERFLATVHPEDRESVDRFLARAIAEHADYQTEYRICWPDGSVHWLSDRGHCLADAQDHPIHMVGAILDITDLKQAEVRMTALLEGITEAFLHLDRQWRFTALNRRVEEYLGKSREALLDQPLWEAFPAVRGTYFEWQLEEAMATRQERHFESVQPWLQRWFEIHAYPEEDGLSIYVHDITERRQAEQALQQSREELHVLIETMPQLVSIMRADGDEEYANQRWYDYTQSTSEQSCGKNWVQFVHPDDQAEVMRCWQEALQTGKGYEGEYRVREGKTGNYQWFLHRTVPLTDEQGRLLKWLGTSTNINERKGAEEALRQSRDAFRLLTEAMPQLVWITGASGDWEYANQQWYTSTASGTQEMLGEEWISCYHPDDRLKVQALWQTSLLTGQPFQVEARLRQGQTGVYRWFLVRAVPITASSGQVWKWIGTCTDIHEKKCAEEALRESEVRFRRLVESNLIGITIVGLDGTIQEANDAFLSLVGYSREEVVRGQVQWTAMTPPEYRAQDAQALEELHTTGMFQPFEKEYVAKDGKRVPVLLGGTLFRKTGAKPLALCFIVDLTAQKAAEEERQEADRRIGTILASITNVVAHLDARWRYTYVNPPGEKYAGKSQEELLGQSFWEINPEMLGTPMEHKLREAMATQQVRHFEAWHPRWKRWLDVHAYPTQGGLSLYSQDITERKRAEEQLQEAHQRITTVLESITDAFSHVDTQWRYTYVNQGLAKMVGKKREEVVGQSLWDVVPEVLGTPFEEAYRQAMATQQTRHIEGFHPSFRKWLDISIYPTPDGISFYVHDITERKQVEEALRESEVRFRHLVQSNIIGITVIDLEGPILEANDAFLSLLGYTRQDLAAGRLNWRALTPPEHQERSTQAVKEVQTTGIAQLYEKEYLTKDGKRVPVLVGTVVFRREGSTQLAISFVLDLTARKEIEQQKDLMLGMTSHELKTPLAALKGTFQILQRRTKRLMTRDDHLSPEVNSFLADLLERLAVSVRQVDVQTRLINDLLDVSRITAGTLKLELSRADLVPIVRETVEDLRVTAPERSLVLDVPEQTAVYVLADRDRISQVITNYVTNALRYSPANQPVQVGLALQEDVARVWVRDQGPGLSEGAQKAIWQRFHQVKGMPVLSGSGKGLGLGLYICQMLITQHQGDVGVESTSGEGSTFWFTLPLVP